MFNYVNCSGCSVDRRPNLLFPVRNYLDIYILRLIKRLLSVGELISRLSRKATSSRPEVFYK